MVKQVIKNTLVLAVICLVSALTLASINNITAPIIERINKENLEKALLEVSKGKSILDKVDVLDNKFVNYYYNLANGGYLLSLNSNGYGGPMQLLASYESNGKLVYAKLISDTETPGLGKKANNPGYMNKYIKDNIPVNKSMLRDNEAASVSGASITFGAIGKSLAYGQNFVRGIQ